ncbi:hypothetical protein THRCLA_20252 [Thraustotheca clavata]|uniref:Uncharacterized protein n=1 Tax=Thraustotheca clavata TaxID=74557 RepID=A0A1W0A9I7_9STRA|nr:hypothetical protein THRCLA_20252 [Thraustotheca clavata]
MEDNQELAMQDVGDDDWEMPLLFMTNLPLNFTDNADIAALSTFSEDYEEEEGTSLPKCGKIQDKGKYRVNSRSKPYSKSRKVNVAELQVCMKLFNM